LQSRIFCFDLETTGLPTLGLPVVPVQIAGVVLDPNVPGLPEIGEFHEFMQVPAYAHFDPEAIQMHAAKGRTPEWYQMNGKPPAEVYRALDAFLRGFMRHKWDMPYPAGHNVASFDIPILNREIAMQLGKDYRFPLRYHILDTMGECTWRKMLTGAPDKLKLSEVARHFSVPLNEEEAHDALVDVKATAEILRRIWTERKAS
jgi:DNA polymerase III epsilon subunit-like protein